MNHNKDVTTLQNGRKGQQASAISIRKASAHWVQKISKPPLALHSMEGLVNCVPSDRTYIPIRFRRSRSGVNSVGIVPLHSVHHCANVVDYMPLSARGQVCKL